MRHYLLPRKLKKGDRIILWGTGYVGKQYISLALHYGIEIVKCLDQYADLTPKFNHYMKPVFPKQLQEIDCDEYDYIVIAVHNQDARNEIRKILHSWNIDASKIVDDIEYYDDIRTLNDPDARAKAMMHFSWNGEDIIMANIFERLNIDYPSYLDIGCNDPFLGSNTAYFYLSGSKGVCVDANPAKIHDIMIKRPDDIAVCCGVFPEEAGTHPFYIYGNDGLSSFSRDYVNSYDNDHSSLKETIVREIGMETHCLSWFVNEYCTQKWPDILDMDIEGLDDLVMQSVTFDENRPKVICIESHDEKTREHVRKQGYFLYTYTAYNDIFVDIRFKKYLCTD